MFSHVAADNSRTSCPVLLMCANMSFSAAVLRLGCQGQNMAKLLQQKVAKLDGISSGMATSCGLQERVLDEAQRRA